MIAARTETRMVSIDSAMNRHGRPVVPRPNTLPIAGLTRLAPVGLGLAFGLWYVITAAHRDAPLWPVWMVLMIALTTAAGVVFAYGLNRWAELLGYCTVRVRDVIARPATIVTVSLLVVLADTLPGPVQGTWKGVALFTVVLLGAVPVAGVMEGVRHAANKSLLGTRGEQIAVLVRLRQLLQRLLAAAGSLVALLTLAFGAGAAMLRSLPAGSEQSGFTQAGPQFVLVFGGVGSLLVALFYVPAAAALQRRGQRLCDDLFPLTDAEEASAILSVAEDRHKLEQLLGLDRGVFADLQTGLVILGPLLAGAAAAFLSPNA
jgi:hypothetical protein